MIRSFEINKIETLDDLGSDHLPMISTIKFNNNEISSHNIIKLYHKLDKNHAASLLTELNQKDCNNKEEIDELFNDITEKLKNIHKNIPTKRIKSNNVSLPESTRIKIKKKRKLINYWRKNKTNIIKTKINKLNKEIKKEIETKKQNDNKKIALNLNNEKNPNKKWSEIKRFTKNKKESNQIQKDLEMAQY